MESSILNIFKHVESPHTFAAGETIFTEGMPGSTMYVVLDGNVDISVGGKTLEVAGPGAIVGEMALIDSSARSATAIARDDCTLAPVDKKQFLSLIERTPYFALNVMKILVDRLRHMDSIV